MAGETGGVIIYPLQIPDDAVKWRICQMDISIFSIILEYSTKYDIILISNVR